MSTLPNITKVKESPTFTEHKTLTEILLNTEKQNSKLFGEELVPPTDQTVLLLPDLLTIYHLKLWDNN